MSRFMPHTHTHTRILAYSVHASKPNQRFQLTRLMAESTFGWCKMKKKEPTVRPAIKMEQKKWNCTLKYRIEKKVERSIYEYVHTFHISYVCFVRSSVNSIVRSLWMCACVCVCSLMTIYLFDWYRDRILYELACHKTHLHMTLGW